jgi:probable rRNA maturation factor
MSARDISIIVEDAAWKESGVTRARVKSAAAMALTRSTFLSRAKRGGVALKGRRGQTAREAPSTPTLRAGEEMNPRLTLLLTNDERLRTLNAQFRGKDTPTNVLSFPAEDPGGYLGDIAIAFGVTTREAAAAGISVEFHTLHLAVHGVLHLLGYDHVRNSEARIMERLEIAILDELGIPDPYARAAVAR